MKITLPLLIIVTLLLSCCEFKKNTNAPEAIKEYLEKAMTLPIEQQTAFYKQALSQYANDTLALAQTCQYIGNAYKTQALPDSAYLYYSNAEKWYKLLEDPENIGKMVFYKATLQHHDGDFTRSELSCLQALGYFLDAPNQNKRSLYNIYNLLGILANEQQDYEDAIVYYNKALHTISQDSSIISYNLLKANAFNNLGVAYRNKNEHQQAVSYFTMALTIPELREKIPHLYAMLLDNTAYSRFKLKDTPHNISELLNKALIIRDSLQLISGIVINKLHLSEYYQAQKQSQKAFETAKQAYTLAKTQGRDPRDIMLSLVQLQKVNPSHKNIYEVEYLKILERIEKNQPRLHENITQIIKQSEAMALQKAKIEKQNKAILFWSSMSLVIASLLFIIYAISKKLQLKNAYEKIYNLMLSQEITENEKRKQEQVTLIVRELCDGILSRLFSIRLLLDHLNTKKEQQHIDDRKIYIDELRYIEQDIKKLGNTFLDTEKFDFSKNNFVQLLEKMLKKQKEYTSVTYYIEPQLLQDITNTDIKIKLYQILDESLNEIHRIKKITHVDFAIHDTTEGDDIIIHIKGYKMNENHETQNIWSRIERIKMKQIQKVSLS